MSKKGFGKILNIQQKKRAKPGSSEFGRVVGEWNQPPQSPPPAKPLAQELAQTPPSLPAAAPPIIDPNVITNIAGIPVPTELHQHFKAGQIVDYNHPLREKAVQFVTDVWRRNKAEGKRMSAKLLGVTEDQPKVTKKPYTMIKTMRQAFGQLLTKADDSKPSLNTLDSKLAKDGVAYLDDPDEQLTDIKHSPIRFAASKYAHAVNRLKGISNPFYKLLAQGDEKLINDLNGNDNKLLKALPPEKSQKFIVTPGDSKTEYWKNQADKRQKNFQNYMSTDVPDLQSFINNMPEGSNLKKQSQHELNMRVKYRQKMLDTATAAANANQLPDPPPIHISSSNAKLKADGIVAFDIQPDATCPGAHGDGCLGNCFYIKGQSFNIPDVERKLINNTAATARDDFADRMIEEIHKQKQQMHLKHVRIHSGGDMYHQQYADDWAKVAQAHPDVNFYIYTKSHHLNFDRHKQMPNFTVNHSQGSIYDSKLPEDAPKVEIVPNKEAFDLLRSNGYVDASRDDLAAANNKTGKPLVLWYHKGSKSAYNPKTMLSSKARELIATHLGEERGFQVDREEDYHRRQKKESGHSVTKPKLTLADSERKLQKLGEKYFKLQAQVELQRQSAGKENQPNDNTSFQKKPKKPNT